MKFHCPKHPDNTQEHLTYKITVGGVYKTKSFVEINCPECGSNMIPEESEKSDFNVGILKFNSMSRDEKKKVLKKRSKTDAKKNREYRRHLDLDHLKK